MNIQPLSPDEETSSLDSEELGLAPLIKQSHVEIQYTKVSDNTSMVSRPRCLLRVLALTLVVVGLLSVAVVHKVNQILDSHENDYANFPEVSIGDAVSFAALPPVHPGCVSNSSVCFCARGTQTCKEWKFKVGDVLIFQYGAANNLELKVINFVMKTLFDGAVHAAIVTEVKGPQLTDIIVTECLKGNKMKIIQSTMYEVLSFRTYHGIWIRRVDTQRFPQFEQKAQAITEWSRQRLGEPFSKAGIAEKAVLFPWRYVSPNWIENNPGCPQREKALNLYRSGGPGAWFCSQFVAWTLAFPGGINTDYTTSQSCPLPRWTGMIENLQVAPGDLINQPVYDASNFFIECPMGCDSGLLPPSRRV